MNKKNKQLKASIGNNPQKAQQTLESQAGYIDKLCRTSKKVYRLHNGSLTVLTTNPLKWAKHMGASL